MRLFLTLPVFWFLMMAQAADGDAKIHPDLIAKHNIGKDQVITYTYQAKKGDFLRLRIEQVSAFMQASVANAAEERVASSSEAWFYEAPFYFSFTAPSDGDYAVRFQARSFFDAQTLEPETSEMGTFKVRVVQMDAADAHAEDQKSLLKDPRIAWMREHAVDLRTLEPDDSDFSDLAPVGKAIGKARIVLLGEQSHNTAQTYLGKTRLVKYLHQEMGFELLAMESGFYEVDVLRRKLEQQEADSWDWLRGILNFWSSIEEFQPMARYLAQHVQGERPLLLVGMDNQFRNDFAIKHFTTEFDEFLAEHQLQRNPEHPFLLEQMKRFRSFAYYSGKFPPASMEDKVKLRAIVMDYIYRLGNLPDTRGVRFWRQTLDSLASRIPYGFATKEDFKKFSWGYGNDRDLQMAENLFWLASEYPDKKIIVWAASRHNARNAHLILPQNRRIEKPIETSLGHHLYQKFGDALYSIAFTAYQGRAGSPASGMRNLEVIEPDQHEDLELEEIMMLAGKNIAFLDLRARRQDDDWLRKPMPARPFGHYTDVALWPHVLDAFVFVKEVSPLNRSEFLEREIEKRKQSNK